MKTPATRFADLVVWQKADQFVCKLLQTYSQAILDSDS